MPKYKKELTEKQRSFCIHYLKHQHAERAALEAGYSEQYAKKKAYNLLTLPAVANEVKTLMGKVERRAVYKAADVIDGLADIAFAREPDLMIEDGDAYRYKSPDELTDAEKAAIRKTFKHVIRDKDGTVVFVEYSYELHDKLSALVQMGRHYGLFNDKLHVQHNFGQFAEVSTADLERVTNELKKLLPSEIGRIIEGEVLK